ncbi:hypothetical protein [Variovorax sp. KK3]|uniref:hypothetical protein n=1 Tax=Variovorax sp. KK3 TaxID=1855728 RepID=UPI00097C517F|nr:hypothetical protein [Variovorax sp. KK3]
MNNLGNPAPRPSLNSIARPSAGPNSIVDAFNSRWLTNGEGNKKYLIAKRDDGPLNFEESGWTFGAKSGRALSAGDDRKAQYRHAAEALTLLAESAKKENIGLDAAEAILKAVRKSGGQVAIADVQPHINFIVTATQAKNRQVAAAFVDADVTCEGTEPLHLFSLVKKAQNGAAGATPDGADPSPLAKRTNDILALNAAATSLKGLTAQPRFARSPLAAALAGNAVNPRDARSIIDMLADWPGSLELRVRELLAFPADTKAAAKDVALDVAEQKSILRLAHRVLTGDSFLLTIRDPAERERFEGLGVAAGQLLDDLATGPLDRLEKLASGLYHSPAEVRNRLTQVLTEKQAAAPAPPGRAAKVARPHQAPVVAAPRRPSASNPAPAPDQTRATAVAVAPGPEPDDDEFDIDFVQPREPAQQAERLVPRAAWNAFAPSAVEKLMAEFDVDPMEATEWQSRLDPKHFIRWKLEEQQRTDYPSADFSPSATAYQQEWSDHESREQLWLDLGVSSELEKARFMRFSPDNVEQQLAELRTDSTVSTPPNHPPPDPPSGVTQPPSNYMPPTLPSGKDQPAPNDVPPPPNSVVQPPPNYVPPTLPSGKDQPAPNDIPPPPNTVIPPRASSVNPSPLRDIPPPMRSALRFDSESLSKELLQHNTYLTLSKSGSGPQVEYNGRAYYFAVKQSPRFGWIVGRQREKAERALQAVIRESNIDPRDRKAESAKLAIPQKDVDKVWRSYREDVLTILKADAGTRRHDAYLRERRVKLALKEFSELPAQPPNAQQAVQGYVAVDGGDLANAVPNYFDRVAAASNKRLADSKGIENEDPFVGRLVEALGASGVLNKQTAEGKFGDFKQMTEDFLAAPRTADALGPRPRGLTPEVLFALIPSGMLIKLPSAVGNIFERAGCKAESRDEIGKNPAVKVENVKLATKEYLDTFNTQIDRLQYVGELLTNPDYIALFPSDAQAAIRTLGEEMQEITIKMLDPQGPYISMYRLAQSAQTDPAGVTKQLQESVWVMSPKKTT